VKRFRRGFATTSTATKCSRSRNQRRGFDKLLNRLKKVEAEHPELITPQSPTQRVGGKPREGSSKSLLRPHAFARQRYSEEELASGSAGCTN